MYKEHPVFIKPDNEDIKIWRYLDFTKFLSLLDKHALFFTRVDRLSDPFEGSYSKANIELRPIVYKYKDNDNLKNVFNKMPKYYEKIRKHTTINCWHMNDYESAAMWKLYLNSDEGIAIQSTFKQLTESFNNYIEDDVYIGVVNYIDYKTDWLPEGCIFNPFLHKRKSFEHERELRAIIQNLPIKEQKIDFTQEIFDGGIYIPINLDVLIEKIYLAPTTTKWFSDLVKSIMNKYKLNKEVVLSSLVDGPVY